MTQRESFRSHPDFEKIRSMIHRLQKPEFLAEEIPDLYRREDIRDRCFPTMPMINRFDLSNDKHFVGIFLIARGHFNTFPNYEDRLSHMVEVILENRLGCEPGPTSPAESQKAPLASAEPVGTRLASTLAGQVRDVEAEAPEATAPSQPPKTRGLFLFQNEAPVTPGNPFSVLGVRPASDIPSLMKWVAGDTASSHPYLPIIYIGEPMAEMDLATLEIDIRADPDAFLASLNPKPELETSILPDLSAWWRATAESEDVAFTQEFGLRTKAAFEAVLAHFFPEQPGHLKALGSELRLSEELKSAIALACDLEDYFLEDIDAAEEPSLDQLVQGSISEKCRLSRGIVLERAFACHLLSGYAMDTALCISALELRYAQALRLVGWDADPDPLIDFDDRFLADCRQPLSSYTVCENPVMDI